jgi:hypothetical protein
MELVFHTAEANLAGMPSRENEATNREPAGTVIADPTLFILGGSPVCCSFAF